MQFNLYAADIRIFSYTRRLIVLPMRLKYNAVPSQISSTKMICTYLHTFVHTNTVASQIVISQQHMIHTTQTPNYFLSMLRVYFIAVFFFYNLLPVSSPTNSHDCVLFRMFYNKNQIYFRRSFYYPIQPLFFIVLRYFTNL